MDLGWSIVYSEGLRAFSRYFGKKPPGLNLEKICGILGIFLEVLNSKKQNKKKTMFMIYSCVYERVI